MAEAASIDLDTVDDTDRGDPGRPVGAPRDRWRPAFWTALSALVVVGVALRVRQWSYGRSFWLDEAYLVQNFDRFGLRRLLDPLANGQVAPHVWLWLVDLTDRGGRADERALRLVPLLFGCALLLALAGLAAVVLRSRLAVLTAVALGVVVPQLIYYSNEVKQYSADVFAVTMLMIATVLALRSPYRIRWLVGWAVVAAGGVWVSQAMVLAIPAVAVPLLVATVRAGWRSAVSFLVLCAGVAVSVAVELRLIIAATEAHGRLTEFWAGTYPPEPLTFGGTLGWVGSTAGGYATDPLGLTPGLLVLGLAAAGFAAVVARSGWLVALALVAPIGAALAAGFLRIYPPTGRLVLFTVPLVLVLVAAAVDGAADLARRWTPRAEAVLPLVALGLVAVSAAGAVTTVVREARRPPEVEALGSAFAYVAAHQRPDDAVVIPFQAEPSARVYVRRQPVTIDGTLRLQRPSAECRAGAEPVWVPKTGRVWVIVSRQPSHLPRSPGWDAAAVLARTRRVVDVRTWTEAGVVLLEAGGTPDRSGLPPGAVENAERTCLSGRRGLR